jgi:4-aminobutyrate aminotransferase-like enzyme
MNTRHVLKMLRDYESRNITFSEPDGSWPIVWEKASGVHVWDPEGRKYLDLTAAFGVAACGHANKKVVKAGQRQMATLLHAMGDVHPHARKALLARELSRLTFERWKSRSPGKGKTIFCNSGFEAVEAALKTALLATGHPGVIAFESAYHGLGYGALNTTHRSLFKAPFKSQLAKFGVFAPFPTEGQGAESLEETERALKKLFARNGIGAVLVEPIQVRGGINIPPGGFLKVLRTLCDQHQALLILDEIYTGFGRTGKWFACEHSGVVPDVICLGKALTGGFPLSACVGKAEVMDAAWPAATGEAIHTSTFLGHPVGCAMALAQIQELREQKLVERSARLGKVLLDELEKLAGAREKLTAIARGKGLLAGLGIFGPSGEPGTDTALRILKEMLGKRFVMLPEGRHSNILSFSPPLMISETQLRAAVSALGQCLGECS